MTASGPLGARREASTTRVVCISVTEAGRELARRLPYESLHGEPSARARSLWDEVDGLVLMLATGAAVRIVAPLLGAKSSDPAVVCVDESASWAVALCGGHAGGAEFGANHLAREVASLLGAEPVVTTATDSIALPALDTIPGYSASGDVAGVTSAMLGGRLPFVESRLEKWPVPAVLRAGHGPERVVVTDAVASSEPGLVLLRPPSLVAGVGCSTDATSQETSRLLEEALASGGLARASVGAIATIESRRTHRALTGIGPVVRAFAPEQLARVTVPNPSEDVERAVGSPSVAEAAALLAAGAGAELVVQKRRSAKATVALARRAWPAGHISVVGLGPAGAAHRTPAASRAVRGAQFVIGHRPYLSQAADLVGPSQVVEAYPLGEEVPRARRCIELARAGSRVALVCSGDPGVYAMASIVLELASSEAADVEVEVVPGVTASLAAASLLGAPLGHDHASISLSDLMTPWEVIARRLRAAAASDLVVALYNPRSRARSWQLDAALDILRGHRPPETPVGVVTDAYRDGEQVTCTTLAKIDTSTVGMTTCVLVGATSTRAAGGRMFTPRGYRR